MSQGFQLPSHLNAVFHGDFHLPHQRRHIPISGIQGFHGVPHIYADLL